jgi:hypothetical protein
MNALKHHIYSTLVSAEGSEKRLRTRFPSKAFEHRREANSRVEKGKRFIKRILPA